MLLTSCLEEITIPDGIVGQDYFTEIEITNAILFKENIGVYISPSNSDLEWNPKVTKLKREGAERVDEDRLRDSENSIMSYDDIDDEVVGTTVWGKITEWFEKSGYVKVYSNVGLSRCSIEDVARLSEYADNGFKVVCLISAGMLFDFGSDDNYSKNHWVVLADALKNASGKAITKNSPPDEIVNLKLFSWGR